MLRHILHAHKAKLPKLLRALVLGGEDVSDISENALTRVGERPDDGQCLHQALAVAFTMRSRNTGRIAMPQ